MPLSYCAFVRDLSYGSNRLFGVGLRVIWGLVGETEHSPTFVRNLSLSLEIFSLFSLCRCSEDAGCRGLRAGRAVAIVSRGFRETRRSPENSRVFRRLSFFFFSFIYFFIIYIYIYIYIFSFFPGSLHYLPLKRSFVLESLKLLYQLGVFLSYLVLTLPRGFLTVVIPPQYLNERNTPVA